MLQNEWWEQHEPTLEYKGTGFPTYLWEGLHAHVVVLWVLFSLFLYVTYGNTGMVGWAHHLIDNNSFGVVLHRQGSSDFCPPVFFQPGKQNLLVQPWAWIKLRHNVLSCAFAICLVLQLFSSESSTVVFQSGRKLWPRYGRPLECQWYTMARCALIFKQHLCKIIFQTLLPGYYIYTALIAVGWNRR